MACSCSFLFHFFSILAFCHLSIFTRYFSPNHLHPLLIPIFLCSILHLHFIFPHKFFVTTSLSSFIFLCSSLQFLSGCLLTPISSPHFIRHHSFVVTESFWLSSSWMRSIVFCHYIFFSFSFKASNHQHSFLLSIHESPIDKVLVF